MKNKYGAIRTTIDNITFASKAETTHYSALKLLLNTGKIANLKLQPRFPIYINSLKVCDVVLDFEYDLLPGREKVFVDVKGRDNALSKLKRKMVCAAYGIKVTLA